MANYIQLHDRMFHPIISPEEIETKVAAIGETISSKYAGKNPLFVAVLTGSFMFAADLMRHVRIPCEITFIRAKSYEGVESTGQVKITGLNVDELDGRHVIILEDIVDTGLTLSKLLELLEDASVESIAIATLLLKPESLKVPLNISYSAFEIGNEFVVGYGIDYDGLGRNLAGVYQEGK